MSATTKIINVLKGDTFDDVFDLFKSTDAQEVIFIFPKGSKLSLQGQYFEAIKNEADASDKKVSIMTSDPAIIRFASQFNLDLLEQPAHASKKTTGNTAKNKKKISVEENDFLANLPAKPSAVTTDMPVEMNTAAEFEPEIQSAVFHELEQPTEADTDDEVAGDKNNVFLAAAKAIREPVSYGRQIKDIFTSEPDRQIRIKEEKTKPIELDIKSDTDNSRANDITKVWAENESRKNKSFSFSGKTSSGSRFPKKIIAVILGLVVLVGLVVAYSTLGNAYVTLNPQKQPLNFTLKVSASATANSVDTVLNRIPGQSFTDKESLSDTFPATGQQNVVQKAGGQITIYNKSFVSQRLVATTRFKTPDGLIFRIPQTITVPAATKNGSQTTEGSVISAVYSDRPGVEYNISATTFTIPGFEGTPKASDFYAKSFVSMTGGLVGLSNIITADDFAKAQTALTVKLKDKILKSVQSQAGELKILDSTPITFDAPVTNAKVGDGAQNLQMTITGTANIVAFRESDVFTLIQSYVSKNGNSELLQNGLTIAYTNPQLNTDGSMLSFDVNVTGQSAAKIDTTKIMQDIPGMSENTIRTYFGNIKEIDSAHIILSPFWVKSIPKDIKKIKININEN